MIRGLIEPYMNFLIFILFIIPITSEVQMDSSISYSEVVPVDSATKWQIFSKTLTWLGITYKDFKFETNVRDKEAAHLGGKGYCNSKFDKKALKFIMNSESSYEFTFDIWIIDGKYRYVFSDIYSEEFGLLTESEKCPVKILFMGSQKMDLNWREEKKAFDREIHLIIASLKYNNDPATAEYSKMPPE